MGNQNGSDLAVEDLEDLLSLVGDFLEITKSQRSRGLNDFNVFSALLSISDEVRLHSRFIYYLLNPDGPHGQGTLFLELFLKEIGFPNEFDITSVKVYKEYQFIDLYITDGSYHIIIENKIYAADQKEQIQRYIEVIRKENEDQDDFFQNLSVVYLSLDSEGPSPDSFGKYKFDGKDLTSGDIQIPLKSIHYDQEILEWIRESILQVENITNLSVGLSQYESIVLQLYGKYKGKIMTLKSYIENREDKSQIVQKIISLCKEYEVLKKEMMEELFEEVEANLQIRLGKDPQNSKWEVRAGNESFRKYNNAISIFESGKDEKITLVFEFDKADYVDALIGIKTDDKTNSKELIGKDNGLEEKFTFEGALKRSTWFLGWNWFLPEGYIGKGSIDLFEVLVEKETKILAGDISDSIFKVFEEYQIKRNLISHSNLVCP